MKSQISIQLVVLKLDVMYMLYLMSIQYDKDCLVEANVENCKP